MYIYSYIGHNVEDFVGRVFGLILHTKAFSLCSSGHKLLTDFWNTCFLTFRLSHFSVWILYSATKEESLDGRNLSGWSHSSWLRKCQLTGNLQWVGRCSATSSGRAGGKLSTGPSNWGAVVCGGQKILVCVHLPDNSEREKIMGRGK